MDAHPLQQVTQIALGRDGYTPGEAEQVLRLQVFVRGGDWGESLAFCRPAAPGMVCGVEGDGGSFSLEGRPDGRLMLRPLGEGVVVEGRLGFYRLSAKVGDDGAFLIPPVPADACP